MVDNYMKECRLIAQKVDAKVTLMSVGSICFRFALLCFIFLMATLFLPNSHLFRVLLPFGLFGIFASFLYVNRQQPSKKNFLLPIQKLSQLIGRLRAQQNDASSALQPTVPQSDTKSAIHQVDASSASQLAVPQNDTPKAIQSTEQSDKDKLSRLTKFWSILMSFPWLAYFWSILMLLSFFIGIFSIFKW